ncbi:Serine/threonine-protein kinase PrkC [Rubripirellula obstinata]|uniref:Serine/threonine-protein kinase PrkC n=2 Tax=Rubripirellula obstinata TaxID=406547 RepID=A0A5B1CGX5_9BACT|nr:Serine/threonine-protein kinase PrkC [Rubripirellula obstinata]
MTEMSAERLERIESIFRVAIELDGTGRDGTEMDSYLAQQCGNDIELKQSVLSLIERDRELENSAFLEQPTSRPLDATVGHGVMCGKRLGAFELIRHIGSGGMGDVYLGVRDDEFKQQAAVKLIRLGVDGEKITKRFRSEMQFLATLGTHPGITSILDAGATDTEQLYIAMDYVDGLRINEYCDTKRLTIRDRLRLFCKACEAVQFAHQNAVLHCDLKPSNLLVTAEGQPMLIDFGVAKLTADAAVSSPALTQTLQHAFTPGYASPEQINGQCETTATDVYSLGVILYELLSGRQPHRMDGRSLAETVKLTCDITPAKPSSAVKQIVNVLPGDEPSADSNAESTPAMLGELRGVGSKRLQYDLRGDLDRIIMKAIDKQVERRYATVEQLTEDIQRFLDGKPVKAQPDRLGYRVKKFVRRNAVAVTLAASFLLMLLLGITITSRLALVERRAAEAAQTQRLLAIISAGSDRELRSIAEKREKTANEVAELFDEILVAIAPQQTDKQQTSEQRTDKQPAGERDFQARTLIQQFTERFESRDFDDPVIEARLHQSLASASIATGDFANARKDIRRAVRLFQTSLGQSHPATIGAILRDGQLSLLLCEFTKANRELSKIVAMEGSCSGSDPELSSLQFAAYLGLSESESGQGRHCEAVHWLKQAQEKIPFLVDSEIPNAKADLSRRRNRLLKRKTDNVMN